MDEFTFLRRYTVLPYDSEYEIHLFSDTSLYAIGSCIYLRYTYNEQHQVALVAGKSCLLPKTQVKRFTIHRKELLALELGIDMLVQCKASLTLNISRVVAWVDSTTVIKWCVCEAKELLVFVQNRVDKIMKILDGEPPYYIEMKQSRLEES